MFVQIRMRKVRCVVRTHQSCLFLIIGFLHNQVSECIKLLQTNSTLPIQRARMRIRVSIPSADEARLREKILEGVEKVEREGPDGDEWSTVRVPDVSRCEINHTDLHVLNFTARHNSSLRSDPPHRPKSLPHDHRPAQQRVQGQGTYRNDSIRCDCYHRELEGRHHASATCSSRRFYFLY